MRKRLADAAVTIIAFRVDDFTDRDAALAFMGIIRDLTLVGAEGDEGDIKASVQRLSDAQAERVARDILGLYHLMARLEA